MATTAVTPNRMASRQVSIGTGRSHSSLPISVGNRMLSVLLMSSPAGTRYCPGRVLSLVAFHCLGSHLPPGQQPPGPHLPPGQQLHCAALSFSTSCCLVTVFSNVPSRFPGGARN